MVKNKKFHHKARYRGQKKTISDSEGPEGPASANGHNFLYGKHAVLSALANPQRQIRRLLLTLELHESLLSKVEQALSNGGHTNIEIMNMERRKIEGFLPPGAVHQGIALEAEALKKYHLEDIINQTSGDAKATIIILDQATDTQNIGAILRSTAAFGGAAVIIQDRNSPIFNGTMAKAASGALEHVALVRTTNLVRAMDKLKAAEYWCVGLDGQATKTLAEAKLSGRVVLVLGAEGVGLRRLIRENCDLLVRVPMNNAIESLNLSNAAAIALYEKTRN
jgi:23S rRNA (guanosine2251-2'-O)-methyltransferase